ncbi:MAG: hypothetical protein R6T90_09495 [Dissulfuribacterales bacterium]
MSSFYIGTEFDNLIIHPFSKKNKWVDTGFSMLITLILTDALVDKVWLGEYME